MEVKRKESWSYRPQGACVILGNESNRRSQAYRSPERGTILHHDHDDAFEGQLCRHVRTLLSN